MDSELTTTLSIRNMTDICNIQDEAKKYLAYQIGIGLHRYYFPFLIPIGVVFNVLSFCVMMQPSNRKISFCVYLAALAVTDNVVLYTAGHYYMSSVVFMKMTSPECKAISGIFQMFSVASTFLIVAVTVDRFGATCFAVKSIKLRTPKHARRVTAVVIITSIIFNMPMTYTANLVDEYTCVVLGNDSVAGRYFAIFSMILFTIVPFSIILSLNIAIARTIKKRRQARGRRNGHGAFNRPQNFTSSISSTASSELPPTTRGRDADKEGEPGGTQELQDSGEEPTFLASTRNGRSGSVCALIQMIRSRTRSSSSQETGALDRQLAKMLLAVSFTFLVLTLPQYVRYTVFSFCGFRDSGARYATYILVVNITNKLCITNSAVNFVLYCISGRRFRTHLKHMIQKRKCCINTSIVTGEVIA